MKKVRLGSLAIQKLHDRSQALPMAVAIPGATKQELERLRRWYWDDSLSLDPSNAQMMLSVHSFVLQVDGLNILIDTCEGNHKKRSLDFINDLRTPYLENLAKLGLQPSDIHIVMCTHLHMDHVGWNTRLENGRWVPTFPNARYLFGRKDYDYFSTQHHEPFHREAFDDSVLPVVTAGLADMVDDRAVVHREIGDGIWLQPAPGHSPGCLCIHAERGGSRAVFSGDLFHHPILVSNPDLRFFGDFDSDAACQTRRQVLAAHADTDAVFFPAHFQGQTAGRVATDGSGFRFDFLAE